MESKQTALCPTCGHTREVSVSDEGTGCFIPPKTEVILEKTITGCVGCPFKYEYDMGVGYGCKADDFIRGQEAYTNPRTIMEDKKHQPITPDWCPLKKESIILKFEL